MKNITLTLSDKELESIQSLVAFAVAATEASKYGKMSFRTDYGSVSSNVSLDDLVSLQTVLTPLG